MGVLLLDFLVALSLLCLGAWACLLLLRLFPRFDSLRLLRLSLPSSDLGRWCYEASQDTVFLDGRARSLLGLPTRAARLAEFLERVVPEDRERVQRLWLAADSAAAAAVEFRVRDTRRELRHLSLAASPPGWDGGRRSGGLAATRMGTLQDVTELKRVEIALGESEARFSTIFRNCPVGIAFFRAADGVLLDANPAFRDIYGLERGELEGRTSLDLELWSSAAERAETLALLEEGRGCRRERGITRPDGQRRHLHISIDLVLLDGERYLLWTLLDVTENRRSQALASRNERLAKAIMDSVDVAVAVLDQDGNILHTNRKWAVFPPAANAGLAMGEGLNYFAGCRRSMPGETAQAALEGMAAVLSGRLAVASVEYSCPTPEGERWYLLQATSLGSGLQGLATVHMDITPRRQAEAALRQRLMLQDKLARVAASVPGVIYSIKLRPDGSFCLPYAMQGAVDIFGLDPADLVEDFAPALQRIHGADQERVLAAVLESAGSMAPWHAEFRVHHPRGGIRWVETRALPRREEDGCVVWHGYVHDVSGRKQADEELRCSRDQLRALNERLQRVREEERARISLEIHDQLGQNLTALKLDMAWLRSRLAAEQEEERQKLAEIGRLLDDTLRAVRSISWELRPGILDTLGLEAGIDWLAGDFSRRLGIRCQVSLPERRLKLPDTLATHLFRICQELLTNVARHAQASRVDIALSARQGWIELQVRDNGVGLAPSRRQGHSLGLLGIKERAAQCGGEAVIVTRPEYEGTRVQVSVPSRQGS